MRIKPQSYRTPTPKQKKPVADLRQCPASASMQEIFLLFTETPSEATDSSETTEGIRSEW